MLIPWIVGLRVRRLTDRGQHEVGTVLDAVRRAELAGAAMRDIGASRSAQPLPRPTPQQGRRLRFVAIGLTGLNAAAVVPMLGLSDPSVSAIGIAVLLGTLLAVGQIAFAIALGRRLQEDRHAATLSAAIRRLERAIPIEAVALALLSTLVGWVIYLWTRDRLPDDQAQLGVLLGATLALQAWVAPWLLVAETAGSRPSEARRLDMVDHRLDALAADWELDRSTAALALVAARSALHGADRIAARAAERSSQPVRASWSYALRQLAAATAEAEARYAALVSGDDDTPSARDDELVSDRAPPPR